MLERNTSLKDILLSLKDNYSTFINSLNEINLILDVRLDTSSNPNKDIIKSWDKYYQRIKNIQHVYNDWFAKISEIYNEHVEDNSLSLTLDIIPCTKDIITTKEELLDKEIKDMYKKYLEEAISKKEWLSYKKQLSSTKKNYIKLLESNSLNVKIPNIKEKLTNILNPSLTIAEEIMEKNKLPKDYILIDNLQEDPFSILEKDKKKFLKWLKQDDNTNFLIKYCHDKKDDKSTSYLTKKQELGQIQITAYIDRKKYRVFTDYPTSEDYEELWLTAYPNLVTSTYSKEGINNYKKYLKKIDTYYEKYKENGRLYLNTDEDIYYDSKDGDIHYKDDSIQHIYTKELKWTLKILFKEENINNKSAIKDIYMLANGYIEYKHHNNYRK